MPRNALELGQDNQRRLNQMLANGDFVRLADNHVSDLLVGLSFPDQSAPVVPSPFATLPAILQLPDLSEALAIAPNVWPGPTNSYNEDGTLKTPSSAFVGQNVALGVALGNPSVRSFLMGLTQQDIPTANKLAQLHRLTRALVKVLETYETAPLTYAAMRAMWVSLLNPVAPGLPVAPSSIISSNVANAPLLSNFTAETVIFSIPIPAGSMAVNQALLAQVVGYTVGLGSGNAVTYRVRLDSTAGTALLVTPAYALTGPDIFDLRVQLSRGRTRGGCRCLS